MINFLRVLNILYYSLCEGDNIENIFPVTFILIKPNVTKLSVTSNKDEPHQITNNKLNKHNIGNFAVAVELLGKESLFDIKKRKKKKTLSMSNYECP